MGQFEHEVAEGKRFEFGKNWTRFLDLMDDSRIAEAENSLKMMLQLNDLSGRSFLDIGSGSGLFSLAARRLGAIVHSFDYDSNSVFCTRELKRRYSPDDKDWIIHKGSILDRDYIESLRSFDIVYSWGVLHHTGNMWEAMGNTAKLVKNNGLLFIAIYNDQGWKSQIWRFVKKTYNKLPNSLKGFFSIGLFFLVYSLFILKYIVLFKPLIPIKNWIYYKKNRGMSPYVDWRDWIGGYPYEVASPEEVEKYFEIAEFKLKKIKITSSLGCNEFVFEKM